MLTTAARDLPSTPGSSEEGGRGFLSALHLQSACPLAALPLAPTLWKFHPAELWLLFTADGVGAAHKRGPTDLP